jgi:hypothetical protein
MNIFSVKKFVFVTVALAIVVTPLITIAQNNPESSAITTEKPPKTLQITAISHNVSNRVINVGETLSITIKGTVGVEASILLIGDKQTVQEYQAQETTPGVYVANITLNQGDRFIEGAMIARLQKGSQVIYSAAEQAFSVNATNSNQTSSPNQATTTPTTKTVSLPLTITSHQNGDKIANNGIVIQGQTEPNAEVKIKITSSTALVGNMIQIEGDTLIDSIVIALTLPKNPHPTKGLQYQISAIAYQQNSQSRLVQLTLILQ